MCFYKCLVSVLKPHLNRKREKMKNSTLLVCSEVNKVSKTFCVYIRA